MSNTKTVEDMNIELVVWKDISTCNADPFSSQVACPTFYTTGFVIGEIVDKGIHILRICYSYTDDEEAVANCDFIDIPVGTIIKRIPLRKVRNEQIRRRNNHRRRSR